jgi:hypothetical protein
MPKQISQKPVQPNANVRTPSGHFNSQGQSQGQQSGAVRKSPDACNDCNKPKGK